MWNRDRRADLPDMASGSRSFRLSLSRETGQTMAEYAIILGVITPAVVVAFATLGDAIIPMIDRVIGFLS
jgi:Flp pilus assembly pilin Flp